MNRSEIGTTLLHLLGEIAPEVDPAAIQPDVPLRDQFDIDSMDFLNFLILVARELKLDIPETVYPQLATLNGFVDYVEAGLSKTVS